MKNQNGNFGLFFNHNKECSNCGTKSGVRSENENQYRCPNCSSFV